jgi:hypothetical protein
MHNKEFRTLYKQHGEFYGARPVSPIHIIERARAAGFTLDSCIEDVPNHIKNKENENLKKVIIVEFLTTIYSELVFTK